MTHDINANDVINVSLRLTEEYIRHLRLAFHQKRKTEMTQQLHQARISFYPIIANYVAKERNVDDLEVIGSVFQTLLGNEDQYSSMEEIGERVNHLIDQFLHDNTVFLNTVANSKGKISAQEAQRTLQSCCKILFLKGNDEVLEKLSRERFHPVRDLFKSACDKIIQQIDQGVTTPLWRDHLMGLLERSEQYLQTIEQSMNSGFQSTHFQEMEGSRALSKQDAHLEDIVDIETHQDEDTPTPSPLSRPSARRTI